MGSDAPSHLPSQISILTVQVNALAQRIDPNSPLTAGLPREQITKLISDALIRSLEGQPFSLEPAAAPAAPAPAAASAPRTFGSRALEYEIALAQKVLAECAARPGWGAGPVASPSAHAPASRHSAPFGSASASAGTSLVQTTLPRRSFGTPVSSRANVENASGITSSLSGAARPAPSPAAASGCEDESTSGDVKDDGLLRQARAYAASVSGGSRFEVQPSSSAPTTSRAVAPSQRSGTSGLPRAMFTGTIPTVKAVGSTGPWLHAARQWTEGGEGLEGPLKNYQCPWGAKGKAFHRRKTIGREYERLNCSVTEFKKVYPDADTDSLYDLCSNITRNGWLRR